MAHTESMQSLSGVISGEIPRYVLVIGINLTGLKYVKTVGNGRAHGVMVEDSPPAEAVGVAPIAFSGIAKVRLADAVDPGNRLVSSGNGEAEEGAGANQFGIALTGGLGGEVISVLIKHQD